MADSTIRIVTHNGGFHADDVFGVAALALLLEKENIEVIRSRDQNVVDSGEYVLDVGFVYDSEKNRFDHHQEGGAGERGDGVPYASFGLIWKKYGAEIAGSPELASAIEERLVKPVDAYDNGYPLFSLTHEPVSPFLIQDVIGAFEPLERSDSSLYESFLVAVAFAKDVLLKLMDQERHNLSVVAEIQKIYTASPDKRLILFPEGFIEDRVFMAGTLGQFSDTCLFVRQHENKTWQTVSVTNPPLFYNNRFLLPENWAGKSDDALASVTGVPDAFFCHNKRFMVVAKTKEGAIRLAQIALAG